MRARTGLLAMVLAVALAPAPPARGQGDYEAPARPRATPGDAPRASRARPPTTRRATAPATAVRPLPPPAHPKELEPAPGNVSPAGPVPAPPAAGPLVLVGATVHTVSGPTLEGGWVLVEDGRVKALGGAGLEVPAGARRVELAGRHLYPALVSADTVLGLTEIGAVRATRDTNEVGDINPDARAEVAVDPDSELLPVTRSNGVLVALTAPRGGLISGTGALLELDGWTGEEMTLKAPAGLWMEWPGMALDRSPAAVAATPLEKQARLRDERVRKVREAFQTARAYARGRDARDLPAKDRDVKWEAMAAAVRGEIPVVIHAGSILEIKAALRFADEEGLRLVLAGGQDSWLVADELRRRKVPVLVGNVMDVGRDWEPYDVGFTTPLRLHEAGVEFAITSAGEAANARNLPYVAAKAVAYGLPAEEALRAITLYPARIFGLGDRLGSIEPGKDATLIVTDGDPLDIRSNVHRAFIRGKELDLTDRHKRLYERFRLKPRRSAR